MRLFVVALSGDRLEVEVEPTATVLDLKQSISARRGLPVDRQRLVFCGKELEDDHTIEQCGAAADSVLHLVEVKPAVDEGDDSGGVAGAALGGGGNEGAAHGQLFLNIEQYIAAHQTQTVGEVRAQLEDVNVIVQRFKCCPAADKVDEVAAALLAEAAADESRGREFGAQLKLDAAKAMLDSSKQKAAKAQDVQNKAASMRAAAAAKVAAAEERREEVQRVYNHASGLDDKCQREIRRLEQLQLSLIATQDFDGADNAASSADAYHALLRKLHQLAVWRWRKEEDVLERLSRNVADLFERQSKISAELEGLKIRERKAREREEREAQEREKREAREREEREAREREEREAREREEREAREREEREAREREEREAREREEREAREREEREAREREERKAREREAQERERAAISMCTLFYMHHLPPSVQLQKAQTLRLKLTLPPHVCYQTHLC